MRLNTLYLWAMTPAMAMAAEGLLVPDEAGLSISSVILQGGIGGLAALVAVKMLLVLYNDKEKNSNEFHGRLLQVIESQISVNKDMIASNNELIKTMNEIKNLTHENRTIFLRHVNRELVE
ncbi:MAG: hypothetical protein KA142_02340 [Chromatiaceae bacterium]|nr:hypothetical protein [Chromatiaceae bacterium]